MKKNSQELVSKKIKVLRHEGVPEKQAIATAISMGKAGRITKSGGYRRGQKEYVGAKCRSKGSRIEREIVHLCRDAGFEAHRVPLSGAVREYPGDLMIDGMRAEVKCRGGGSGFTLLERW